MEVRYGEINVFIINEWVQESKTMLFRIKYTNVPTSCSTCMYMYNYVQIKLYVIQSIGINVSVPKPN